MVPSKSTKAPVQDRQGPKAGSVGSLKAQGLRMGYPGSLEAMDVPRGPRSDPCALAAQPPGSLDPLPVAMANPKLASAGRAG